MATQANTAKARTQGSKAQEKAAPPKTTAASQKEIQQQKEKRKQASNPEAQAPEAKRKNVPTGNAKTGLPFAQTTSRDPERLAKDKNIANSVSNEIESAKDQIRPILEQVNNFIAEEDRKDPKERNEDELVKKCSPLISQAGDILQKCNSNVRGLDPSGQLRMRAQGEDALPEERRAASLLNELTGDTVRQINDAKAKLQNMPKAEKKMSGLWKMVGMPLVQIIAAVAMLVTGVLGLVAQLLNTVGLGQLIGGILGKVGLNKLLKGIGLDLKGGGGKGGLLGITGAISSTVFGTLDGVMG